MNHDNRPALARYLWRNHTQEHWTYSLSIEVIAQAVWLGTVLGGLYLTRGWWGPAVLDLLCQPPAGGSIRGLAVLAGTIW